MLSELSTYKHEAAPPSSSWGGVMLRQAKRNSMMQAEESFNCPHLWTRPKIYYRYQCSPKKKQFQKALLSSFSVQTIFVKFYFIYFHFHEWKRSNTCLLLMKIKDTWSDRKEQLTVTKKIKNQSRQYDESFTLSQWMVIIFCTVCTLWFFPNFSRTQFKFLPPLFGPQIFHESIKQDWVPLIKLVHYLL